LGGWQLLHIGQGGAGVAALAQEPKKARLIEEIK